MRLFGIMRQDAHPARQGERRPRPIESLQGFTPCFALNCEFRSACGRGGSPLLETLPAINRSSLGELERHCRFLATLRAYRCGHDAGRACAPRRLGPLCLAVLATLRLILKALIRVEHLFPGREDKLSSALNAFKDFVLVLHGDSPLC